MKSQQMLVKLKAEDKDHKVISALYGVLQDNSIDMRINVIGAMHTSGWLKNRIQPFWKDYEHGSIDWIKACIKRAIESDFDDLCVSSMLNCDILSTARVIKEMNMRCISSRYYDDYKLGRIFVLTFAKSVSDRIVSKAIEIGWSTKDATILDFSAMRSMFFENGFTKNDGLIFGVFSSTYFRRAVLPHGNWIQSSSDKFEFKPEWNCIKEIDGELRSNLIFL